MKTRNIKLLLFSLFTIGALYSCKKTNTELTADELDGIGNAKQNIANQIKEYGGIPEIFTINQRIPVTLVDMQGKPVNKNEIFNNNLVSVCAGDIPDFVDLKQYVRIYQCASAGAGGYGFKIQFEFNVSWNNNVVLQSPFNANNKTKGRVRITHPTFGTVFDKTTFDTKITDLGVDPVNPSNNIFKVKFTCNDLILATYINDLSYTLRLGATFVSNCSSLDQYGLALSDPAGWGFSPGTGYSACSRNEKGWFQQPGTLGLHIIGIAGFNVLNNSCDYSGVFIKPDLQQVEYSLNGGMTWNPFLNYTATTPAGLGNSEQQIYQIFRFCKITANNSWTI